jgi:hypothetical protein
MNSSATLLLLSSLITGCAGDDPESLDRDGALAAASADLAEALGDPQLRGNLEHALAGKRALPYAEARSIRLSDGRTLGDVVDASGAPASVPYLQIGAPFGTALGGELAVTFEPTDETAALELYAIATAAHSTVDPGALPETPLLVLGIDERATFEARTFATPKPEQSGAYATGDKKWYLRMLEIYEDKEPAYKGDPEIYIMCYPTPDTTGYGNVIEGRLDRVNDTHHEYWWDPAVQPRLNTLRPGDKTKCDIMEADSDSLDDFIDTVTFFSDDATTYREYFLGNAHLKVRWSY